MKDKSQIEKDIAFCIDECEMDDEQIGEIHGNYEPNNHSNTIRIYEYS